MKKIFLSFLFFFSFNICYSQVTFTDVAVTLGVADSGNAQGVAFIDVNNDNYLDIFMVNNNNPTKLWINLNGNAFSYESAAWNVNITAPTRGLSCADFDNDGKIDVMIGNWQAPIMLYKNNGTSFTDVASSSGVNFVGYGGSINWLDYNIDGKIDALFANDGLPPRYNFFFRNDNGSSFTNVAYQIGLTDSNSTLTVASADYDNDGDLDIYMGNQTLIGSMYSNWLYKNNGNGTYTDVTSSSLLLITYYNWGAAWGDFNNDGWLDIFLADYTGLNQLFKNNGDGTFTEVSSQMGVNDAGQSYSAGWADVDNDGDLDLYVARGLNNMDKMYRNDGTTFTDISTASGMGDLRHSSCISWGDYNNDGYLDLYLNNNGSANRLYKNNGGTNKWVIFKLTGVTTNKSAIGSRVTIKIGSNKQIREVEGGSGGKGQNSLPVEFGLGTATIIDSVIVRWQSGTVQRFANVAANQIYSLTEGGPLGINPQTNIHSGFKLYQNYPNPFNPKTNIKFQIPRLPAGNSRFVRLVIYNSLGQEIQTLIKREMKAGEYKIEWDGSNYSSGIYFYNLYWDGVRIETKKMVMIK